MYFVHRRISYLVGWVGETNLAIDVTPCRAAAARVESPKFYKSLTTRQLNDFRNSIIIFFYHQLMFGA